jgi:hypothetical protein
MTLVEIQNALLVLQISKSATMMKPQMEPKKNGKHCTNCGQDNHNVETCRIKKKEEPLLQQQRLPINIKRVRKILHMFTTSMV